ncbi:mechanosensitive ion channel domain-containing protein [Lacinutrix sp. MedPE-SW]|mgnify:CR=1 FL=1|uniref:mechanosensitive ion channel family protein n=1 Tax=Lacinutrix sp. MedPE-SW TaxID=1860087 RepID=UPI00091E79C1|nr:mechanosensitive ion channel domain-containing protein [Lacinutrix sp. MedPE-SW]OIQ16643.1 MAG: mechanosensitive ion channel protein [Lacinutrix sp. MedPE-SW]
MELQKWVDKGYQLTIDYAPKVLMAIVIWIVGAFVIKYILKGIAKAMDKANYDISLRKFLLDLISWILKIVLIIVVLGTVGVETTSFAAIIAAAGLAIGLALQGSLANFAGGVLIMIFKPFKVGDYIKAQGEAGTVKEIDIFTTKLTTPDNKEIIIPNGSLSNGNITNFSTEDTRRVDLTFGVGYDSDIKRTKEVILSVIKSNNLILQEPAPAINVSELADSSINFFTRVWVKKEDFWDVHFYLIEQTKEALDAAGIDIPYPHSVEIQKEG